MKGVKRNQRGFSLIELAIVLVIIGIIVGAVMKGQDLITNARAKKLVSTLNQWNLSISIYMDRNGRLPGDSGLDGLIGNTAGEQTATTSAIGELVAANLGGLPTNPLVVGNYTFWVYIGYDADISKNCIVVCKDVACNTAFTADELNFMLAADTAIDGVADAGLGQFRGATAVTLVGSLAAQGGRANDVVTAVTAVDETTAGVSTAWATTDKAAVWLFDRPY